MKLVLVSSDGNGIASIAPQFWPIALFAVVAMFVAVKRYRQTLD